jgi:hypothetical protein
MSLLTSDEVAAMLGVTRDAVNWLGRTGRLHRVYLSPRHIRYRRAEVAALLDKRNRVVGDPRARPNEWGPRDRPIEHTDLLTTTEAAMVLGISVGSATRLVRRGILPGYQQRPGMRGSRILIPRYNVECLAARCEYRKRRDAWEKGQQPHRAMTPGWEEYRIAPVPVRGDTENSLIDRGDRMTTRQVAVLFGISPRAVRALVERGRLHAFHIKREIRYKRYGEWFNGHRWLYYDKAEVRRLQSDPDFQRNRARWRRGADPERKAAHAQERIEAGLQAFAKWQRTKPPRRDPLDHPPNDTWPPAFGFPNDHPPRRV